MPKVKKKKKTERKSAYYSEIVQYFLFHAFVPFTKHISEDMIILQGDVN